MGEWKETEIGRTPEHWGLDTLGGISSLITDGSHRSPDQVNSKFLMPSVKDMTYDKFDFTNCKTISEKDFLELVRSNCSPQKGDIIISKDGANCLDLIFVYNQDEQVVLLSSLAIVRLKESYSPEFFRYYLLSPNAQFLMRNNLISGSAIPRVVLKDFKNVLVPVPDYSEQRAIATVLSSLDAKIDLLHRQNKTLEAMAETLFRQWFVEGAEEGWEEVDVYSLINVTYGFPFKSQYFNEDGRGLPLIRIRDLKDGVSNVYTDEPCDDKFILQCGDLVAGMDGEFRLYIWSGSKAVLNQRACKFTPAHKYVPYMYVLNLMRPHLHYYENTKVGTTVIHLGKSDIDEIRVALPPKDLLIKYGAATDPMHKKIINNHTQLRSLTALRDTLLPKLMSGEVGCR